MMRSFNYDYSEFTYFEVIYLCIKDELNKLIPICVCLCAFA